MDFCRLACFLLVSSSVSIEGGEMGRSEDIPAEKTELARLASELTQLQALVTAQGRKIDEISGAERVAFAAYISDEPSLNATAGATVLFRGVITNVGQAFNPTASVFTAPSAGLYMFFVRVDISTSCFGVLIRLNGKLSVAANNDFFVSSHVSAGVVLSLQVGDVVDVSFVSPQGYVDAGVESMFLGFKID